MLSAGTQLAHYRIESLIGKGGMGEVYLARDTRLDRRVAIKVLPEDMAHDPERMRRFVQEAKAASAISHANVAHVYEIGEQNGVHYIAMEYVEGQPLSARLKAGALAADEAGRIAVEIADALDAAFDKGVTHRDIKPANIILTARGQVKVLDFGLAKIARPASDETETAATQAGLVMGTVQYMSPEQALGRDVDHRSDLFSLGVVLYEMLTGRIPFRGANATEALDRLLHAAPEPAAPGEPELERITRKCLEKDRERRYQSARDVLVDLRNLQRDSATAHAPPVRPARRVR
ncbi:MAG: serine/threonine-protein kinase, partial [Bryobacteraceae bacterium]